MIKQDKGASNIDGSPNLIISETATIIHRVATVVSEQVDRSYSDVLDDIISAVRVYQLMDTGMTIEEAMHVAGLNSMEVQTIKPGEPFPDESK